MKHKFTPNFQTCKISNQSRSNIILFLAEESKSLVILCSEESQGITNSITYIFTVASSYMIIHFLAFTYVNIFSPNYVTVKTIDKFQYPLILSFSLCVPEILHSILNWNVHTIVKHTIVPLLRVGQMQRLKHSLAEIYKNFNGFQNQTVVESQATIQMNIKSHQNKSPKFLLALPLCLYLKLHYNWVKNLIYSIWIWQQF